MYENYVLPPYTSTTVISQDFTTSFIPPKIEEYGDGITIDFGGFPYEVEYHDANGSNMEGQKRKYCSLGHSLF